MMSMFEHIVQSHCPFGGICIFLVYVLVYDPCHRPLKYGCLIKKSDHVKPTYLKVHVCCLDIFHSAPTSRRIWIIQLMRDDHQNQIVHVIITCLIIFRAHMNILFIINILWSLSGHIGPPIHVGYWPRMVNKFWTCPPISNKYMSFGCLFLDPHLTTYHSIIGVHIVAMLKLGTSTLMARIFICVSLFGIFISMCIPINVHCDWLGNSLALTLVTNTNWDSLSYKLTKAPLQ